MSNQRPAPVTPTVNATPSPEGERPAVPNPAQAQPTAIVTDLAGETTIAREAAAIDAVKGTYTVAPGRTIDGKKPGETVELDETDATRLTKLGFVLDRDGAIVIQTDGPRVVQGEEIVER
jgi:hypothetical protein